MPPVPQSRRGLLAFGWSAVTLLTFLAFLTALIFATTSSDSANDDAQEDEEKDVEVSVTSRAMAFTALWTGILALGMLIYGTVVLGVQSPTGQYYVCCPRGVHRTSSLSLGVFIGGLLMFANFTLVCSVLFGEFHIHDWGEEEDRDKEREGEEEQETDENAIERSSIAFSIMCLFLTVLYLGFASLVFAFHESVISETLQDLKEEAMQPSPEIGVNLHPGGGGYVGGAFETNKPTVFMSPQPNPSGTMT